MYVIQAYGRTYKFETMEEAIAVADDYRARTGFIVGIEYRDAA